ncbi:MAG: acetoacetate decarboxylase family protein [Lachnospiraceae bacterium]|nr:acetoacetate decarboxylase family protein [Lachnospiraceae bacterium]
MFKYEENRMYQMPVYFGPACGPRSGPDGERLYKTGPQECTQHILVYETEAEKIENYFPEGFSVRKPYIIVTHKMHRNLPWLAGRGYNVVTFNVPVTYTGKEETIKGKFQLSIWENHADPIISGREQLGYSKIFADIQDMHVLEGKGKASLSSWDFRFLTLDFDLNKAPEDEELLKSILSDPEDEGLMHYKYFPHTGDGFSDADVAYVTISPNGKHCLPDDLPALPTPERSWCSGGITWFRPTWEDMPTQYHVVNGLADLPVKRIIGASVVKLQHYNDVYDQRVVK